MIDLDDIPDHNTCFVGVRGRPGELVVECIGPIGALPAATACNYALYVLAMLCPDALSERAKAKLAPNPEPEERQ